MTDNNAVAESKAGIWKAVGEAALRGVGLGILLGASFVGGFLYNQWRSRPPESGITLDLLLEAEAVLADDFLHELPPAETRIHGAVSGLVDTLSDPYTYFVEPQSAEVDETNLAGRFGGIGTELTRNDEGQFIITDVYRDNPAFEAGIEAGDQIIGVDEVEITENTSMESLLSLIRGDIGDTVQLTLLRDSRSFEAVMVRVEVLIPSTDWYFLEETPSIGYVQISRFTHRTPEEFKQALRELDGSVGGIILDLRDNGGGLVDSAVAVTDEFFNGGIVLLEDRADGSERTFRATPGGLALNIPVVVLVNGGTASASEIVAGALQSRERGQLVGQQTYGKGSVQVLRTLSDGSTLHITTAAWFTPGGTPLDGTGLSPDTLVENADGEDAPLQEAAALLISIVGETQ